MGLLAAAQHNLYFQLVPTLQKPFCLVFAYLQVVVANAQGKADAFDFDFFALGLCLTRLFLFLVFEMSVVNETADRRLCFWRNFYQIVSGRARFLNRHRRIQHAKRISLMVNHAHLRRFDLFVDIILLNLKFGFADAVAMNAHGCGIRGWGLEVRIRAAEARWRSQSERLMDDSEG